jgi:hypothetical protein
MLSYTHLFKAKQGYVYGTLFEYLAITYGISITWVVGLLVSLFLGFRLKVHVRGRWEVIASAAISIALCYGVWRLVS